MNEVTRIFRRLDLNDAVSNARDCRPKSLSANTESSQHKLRRENERLRNENAYLKLLLSQVAERHTKIPIWVT